MSYRFQQSILYFIHAYYFVVLAIEFRASHILGKYLTTEIYPQPKLSFNLVWFACARVCACTHTHTHTHTHVCRHAQLSICCVPCVFIGGNGVQRRASDSLELELQAVLSCLMWVLGTKLKSFAWVVCVLSCWTSSPVPRFYFLNIVMVFYDVSMIWPLP